VSVVVAHPMPPATRGRRLLAPTATIGGLALATLALHLRDPHQHGSWGLCPFNAATGLYCPGCGGLRAVNDLTDGHLHAALSSNVLVVALMPVAVLALAVWALDRWRGQERRVARRVGRPALVALVAVVVVFTISRNLAFGSWLAP
jgi:hypothetical protein